MRDESNFATFMFICAFVIGFCMRGLAEQFVTNKKCEKTVHYLEQKVTSHAN